MEPPNLTFNNNIQIKGIKEGLLVTFGDGNWDVLITSLLKQIDQKTDFFRGAMLVLDVGFRVLHPLEIEGLKDQLTARGLGISSVLTESPTTEIAAKMLGVERKNIPTIKTADLSPINTQLDGENALLINRTLRSGNKIHYPGHVVVIGDVNPGSEIISGGSVVVWGKLRGMIHAGAEGDLKAVICACEIDRAVLKISGLTELSPKKKWKNGASIVKAENGIMVLQNWDPKN